MSVSVLSYLLRCVSQGTCRRRKIGLSIVRVRHKSFILFVLPSRQNNFRSKLVWTFTVKPFYQNVLLYCFLFLSEKLNFWIQCEIV